VTRSPTDSSRTTEFRTPLAASATTEPSASGLNARAVLARTSVRVVVPAYQLSATNPPTHRPTAVTCTIMLNAAVWW
jgi:hypothetical protein